MNSALKLEICVNYILKSCFFHLRCLAKVKAILKNSHLKSVIYALVTSRLKYANCVLYGLNLTTILRLQLVQMRLYDFLLVLGEGEHIPKVLAVLH